MGSASPTWQEHYDSGVAACREEDFEIAVERFARAIKAAPDRWQPYYGRAWAAVRLDSLGDEDNGTLEQDLREAIRLGGERTADAHALLASVLGRRKKWSDAITHYLTAYGRSTEQGEVQSGLVSAIGEELELIETAPASNTGVERCQRLEESVRAARLPTTLERGLLAEIMATKAHCFTAMGKAESAADALAALSVLAPQHPLARAGAPPAANKKRAGPRSSLPTFENVGGLDRPGSYPFKMRQVFENLFGATSERSSVELLDDARDGATRTILLIGPSGCGKTYMIRAFSGEFQERFGRPLPIHETRLNQTFARYVGDGERHVTGLFDLAISTQPSILFVDEVDALGGSRDSSQDWKNVQTSHLLQELDRLRDANAHVLFLGCTNRIWQVELALVRRFDRMILVELPDTAVRRGIFEVQLKRLSAGIRPENPDLDGWAELSHGFTPGDIAALMRRVMDRMREQRPASGGPRPMRNDDVIDAIRAAGKPRHVRDWVRRSIEALRGQGFSDEADEIKSRYEPYIDGTVDDLLAGRVTVGTTLEAWTESQQYDLGWVRQMRRAQA